MIENRGAEETSPVVVLAGTRTEINAVKRAVERPGRGNKGVLRALNLNADWMGVQTDKGYVRISGVGERVDDVIGPMVNRLVAVQDSRRRARGVKLHIEDGLLLPMCCPF